MKKSLILFITLVFCVGSLYAAPAQRTTAGGGASKKTQVRKTPTKSTATQRATTRKATSQQTKTKSQERQEAQQKEFGLMPSEINELNHNVFHADAAAIKGARDTESALRYLPFVTIVNTAGFGQSFDLRGQGRLSANGVKLYINGIPATPVDNYFSPMPINTVIPSLIQDIEVYPGSGAILYGSGTKGGTINIITSKRQSPYFLVGAGYVNTTASKGNSFNAFAQAAENLGTHFKVNAGVAASVLGGPREEDSFVNGEAVLGAEYDIGWGQVISFDADAFYAKNKTTPYNSLLNFTNINQFMLSYASLPFNSKGGTPATSPYEEDRYRCLTNSPLCSVGGVKDFDPDKNDRATPGYGTIDTTQLRATAKVDYLVQLTQKLKVDATAFGNFNSLKYNTHKMNTPFFVLGYIDPNDQTNRGYNWFLPRPNHPWRTGELALPAGATLSEAAKIGPEGPIYPGDGERADWHFLDQSGSTFNNYKFGAKGRLDWQHDNGLFVFGMDFIYEMSKRNSKTYLRQAIVDGSALSGVKEYFPAGTPGKTDASIKYGSEGFSTLMANIEDKTDINVLTTGVYLLERYDFNRNFSLGMGMRYELKNYDVKITDTFEGKKLKFKDTSDNFCNSVGGNGCDFVNYNDSYIFATKNKDRTKDNPNGIATAEANGEYSKNHDNFTFELAPVFRYSNSGLIFARGELGYNAPPAWAVLRRIGIVWGASRQRDIWAQFENITVGQPGLEYADVLEFDFKFEDTNLKNETYYTAELGWKEMIGTRRVPLGFTNLTINALMFSATAFYTGSTNEFYFEGDTWSGMSFGNYDKSRRIGIEAAAEQYLFGGALGINESFTYLKAQKQEQGEEWQSIPYTYDWKATLGAAVNISTFLEVIDVDVSIWLQNSIYGKQNIYATNMMVLNNAQQAGALAGTTLTSTQQPYFVSVKEDKKLDPYIISDFGVSIGINKNMGVVTVGVKNVFDTFYYDYYNNDRSAVVNENRYVIGRGRTVFVEGTFRY